VANLDAEATEKELRQLFGKDQPDTAPVVQFFATNRSMAYVKMSSTAAAILALIRLHNYQPRERHMRVSFSLKVGQSHVAHLCLHALHQFLSLARSPLPLSALTHPNRDFFTEDRIPEHAWRAAAWSPADRLPDCWPAAGQASQEPFCMTSCMTVCRGP